MRKEESKASVRGKFKKAAWNQEYLVKLLALFWNAITLVISVRAVKIEKHFTGSGEWKGVGQRARERNRHCRVHLSAGCAHGGKAWWNAFAKTGDPGEVNA
jgi:hypothetical protein